MITPRPLALKPRDRKPPDLGPVVRAQAVRLSPAADGPGPLCLINGAGLRDLDKDGFKEHDTAAKTMWQGACSPNLALEFELPDQVPLSAIEVWNYNAEWQTTNGLRKADVAVSADGANWQTVLRGVEFAEADGRADYDEPIILKLKDVPARKLRLENLVPWGGAETVGLSAVIFHQGLGPLAGPLQPEDGASGVGLAKPALRWTPGQGAAKHRVYLGTAADKLASLSTTTRTSLDAPPLKPDTTYFWRVDEVQANGRVVPGRVARFETIGLVAWWKLDETEGATAEDASGHQLVANVVGKPRWVPGQGRFGGALEFDGRQTLINCGRPPEFDFADGITVCAWIKVRQFNRKDQAIVTKGDTAWRLQRAADQGGVMFAFDPVQPAKARDKTPISVVSKRNVDDGQWHHVVGLSDARRVALYLDGTLEQSAPAKPMAQNAAPVMIGCNSAAYDRRFNGWIDDVRLYGYGLSDAEVKALYRAGPTEHAAK